MGVSVSVNRSNLSMGTGMHPVETSLPDWIVDHAKATNLSVPEVERLWLRFNQLGYGQSDSKPLPKDSEHDILSDVFVRNILKTMKNDTGQITFYAFLSIMKWIENAHVLDKLKGIFHLLGNGQEITKEDFKKILQILYVDNSKSEIDDLISATFTNMADNRDKVNEDQFIKWANRLQPETLRSILSFSILPADLYNHNNQQMVTTDGANNVLTDKTLDNVAIALQHKDWMTVMGKLGFAKVDMSRFQQKNLRQKILGLLKEWRRRDARATTEKLNMALMSTNITAIN